MVSPGSSLSFWKRDLDHTPARMLFDFAEEYVKPGHVVWDIGASVGTFTFASSYRTGISGKVVAVEADLFSVGLLRKSISLSSPDRANVVVLPVAVSDSLGIAEFHIAKRGRNANHLTSVEANSQAGGVRETVSVMTITLDWLMGQLPSPNVLKIDVEGAESLVLAGARKLISTARPVVLCEISGREAEACTSFFHSHGYKLYDYESRDRLPIKRAAFNTLAVVEE